MRPKITVCDTATDGRYALRVHFETRDGEIIRFQTGPEFTKYEADYRAVSLSARWGWERDLLPTHPQLEAYPAKEEKS